MAEALISMLLEQLASLTYQHVGEEVKLVLNAEKDVKEFEAKLKVICAVLEDAELRQVRDANVKNWLEQLKDVSYKMDNVLDEWNTEILKQQVEKEEEHGGSTSLVNKKKNKKAVKGGNNTIKPLGDKIRHLTLMLAPEGPLSCVSFFSYKSDLHTLATFDSKFTIVDSTLISQLKHLRTLNLSGNSIEELPEEIGELVHLRFIDLSENYGLKKLPKAGCNLYNLQTLRLTRCWNLESLPQSMGKLINLKHLYVGGCTRLKYLPKGIGRLTNLRTLGGCPFGRGKDDNEAFKLGDLRNLDQLRELWMVIDGEVKVAAGEGEKGSPLENKQQLSNLIILIDWEYGERSAEILNFLRPHPNLESLDIMVPNGITAPNWIMSLNKLRHLSLTRCEVLPPLGKLPSLETLWLWEMKGVKKVGVEFLGMEKETSSASSCITLFPKLKRLHFLYMEAWEEWKEEDPNITIMPCLSL
ncbi:hypothetical protein C1H46_027477 [Malus baccata]|uniref:Uncharacterized protein n=1 Tax=Malus baccata TaxID=106549 RepID=A0A540LKG8_MALBA|nr:hypothetical protein C1H46_027477 [Malus baccata]